MIYRQIKPLKNNSFFIFGPRQTGKSTLLHLLFPEETTYFYDLLKSEEYLRLLSNPSLFREEVRSRPQHITHIVVDEVQKIPILLSEIHLLMESPNPPYFVLSGSSARKLKRTHADLLAGRALSYHLFPLTCKELGNDFSLYKALETGMLPKIYLSESNETAVELLRAYVETYLKEEIELEAQVRQLNKFVQFLTIAGFENGNVLNFSNIARDTGTTYQTVQSYFQILEDTLLGSFLFPYLKSARKRTIMHPKFYFFDIGVTRALTKKLTLPMEPRTPEFGKAFEHFIILEALSMNSYERLDLSFSFYRTHSGAEVDLIIETPKGNLCAVEIKSADSVDSSHFRGLKSFLETYPQAKSYCICRAPRKMVVSDVTVLPWQELSELLHFD